MKKFYFLWNLFLNVRIYKVKFFFVLKVLKYMLGSVECLFYGIFKVVYYIIVFNED